MAFSLFHRRHTRGSFPSVSPQNVSAQLAGPGVPQALGAHWGIIGKRELTATQGRGLPAAWAGWFCLLLAPRAQGGPHSWDREAGPGM